MHARLALALLVAASLLPAALRARAPGPDAPRACSPEGRGVPPRGWLGCAADPGPPRPLSDEERLLIGRPLDPNRAGAEALAFVPGIGPGLARAVVDDREAHGPFQGVEDLVRVRGIGPKRLERARPWLEVPAR
ncbi:MAG TPA: helix-hairpin-helix domain-containing protein [Anaeromyxobacteraceae bacterium]|nr:helix-hairpin-helix domain-containing protein [Anaeromyxobacteraceae bacterium]